MTYTVSSGTLNLTQPNPDVCNVLIFLFLVVSTSAVDCLERLVSEMTCVEWDVKPYTLTHQLTYLISSHCASFSLSY